MRSMPDVRKPLQDEGVDAWRFIGQFADVIATKTTNRAKFVQHEGVPAE